MFQIIQASWLCDVDDYRDLFPASPLNVLFFVNDFQRPTISDDFIIGSVVGAPPCGCPFLPHARFPEQEHARGAVFFPRRATSGLPELGQGRHGAKIRADRGARIRAGTGACPYPGFKSSRVHDYMARMIPVPYSQHHHLRYPLPILQGFQ